MACLVVAPAIADTWYESYFNGDKALKEERFKDAIDQFNRALEKKGDPAAQARTYSMNFIDYHPYLKLGIAYFKLGQYDAALQAFGTEESFGQIAKSPQSLKELQQYRQLALEAKKKAAAADEERIASLVRTSLEEARALEQAGKPAEALAALGKALAVAPKNEQVIALRDKLGTVLASREKDRESETRSAALIAQGKSLLERGKFEEASSALRQALSLKASAEATSLLDESQRKLRAQIEVTQTAQQRRDTLDQGLRQARQLEADGQIARALEQIQTVLAIDGQNREALAMQARLVQRQTEEDANRLRGDEIARLVAEGETQLQSGDHEKALVALNRAIALDPTNPAVQGSIAKVYAELNRNALAAPGTVARLQPILAVADLREPLADGTTEQRVSSPDFTMSGVVMHPVPVDLVVDHDGTAIPVGKGLTVTATGPSAYSFLLKRRVPAGVSLFKVVASDKEGMSSTREYQVRYIRPWHRSPWTYAAAILGVGLALGLLSIQRVRRRRALLQRRFNPYVAGAPVLQDDLFVGREPLLARILQTIHNNSVLLYGERRIGKTSLQHHLKKRLQHIQDPEYDFYPVFIDLQGTPQERFFETLAQDIFQELAPILDGAKPGRTLAEGEPYAYETFVRDVRDVLKVLGKRSTKRVKLILLIDEVDELNAYDPRINQKLRSLFMKSFAENMVAVVSGVGIKKHWESEGSPWYNFFEEVEVKPFTRQDAEALIRKPVQGIFRIEDGVVDRIIERTRCRPYLIQKYCIALVNRAHEGNRRTITVTDVESVGGTVEI